MCVCVRVIGNNSLFQCGMSALLTSYISRRKLLALSLSLLLPPSLPLEIFQISILQNLISARSINRSSQGIELGLYSLNIYRLLALCMCVSCYICCILLCGCVCVVCRLNCLQDPRMMQRGESTAKRQFS